jgi:hypothetical protein
MNDNDELSEWVESATKYRLRTLSMSQTEGDKEQYCYSLGYIACLRALREFLTDDQLNEDITPTSVN